MPGRWSRFQGDIGLRTWRGIPGKSDAELRAEFDETHRQEVDRAGGDCDVRGSEVADVAVLGVPHEQFGQRLTAYVVAETDTRPTEEALRDHVTANLARFKVPREISRSEAI
jgi:fatty-acyl-CoA synthase